MEELKNILLNLKEKKYNALQLASVFKKLEKKYNVFASDISDLYFNINKRAVK